MKNTINAFDKNYTLVKESEIEYATYAIHDDAHKNLDELEDFVRDLGFNCISPRDHKWDPSIFLKVTHPSGKYMTIDTFFKDKRSGRNRGQSVNYGISGMLDDVSDVISKIKDYRTTQRGW